MDTDRHVFSFFTTLLEVRTHYHLPRWPVPLDFYLCESISPAAATRTRSNSRYQLWLPRIYIRTVRFAFILYSHSTPCTHSWSLLHYWCLQWLLHEVHPLRPHSRHTSGLRTMGITTQWTVVGVCLPYVFWASQYYKGLVEQSWRNPSHAASTGYVSGRPWRTHQCHHFRLLWFRGATE